MLKSATAHSTKFTEEFINLAWLFESWSLTNPAFVDYHTELIKSAGAWDMVVKAIEKSDGRKVNSTNAKKTINDDDDGRLPHHGRDEKVLLELREKYHRDFGKVLPNGKVFNRYDMPGNQHWKLDEAEQRKHDV